MTLRMHLSESSSSSNPDTNENGEQNIKIRISKREYQVV